MAAPTIELDIEQGASLHYALLWGEPDLEWREIVSVDSLTPVTLTLDAHTLVDDWPFEVVGAAAPVQLNTHAFTECGSSKPPYRARVVSPTQVQLFNVDGTGWKQYTAGGKVKYNAPSDITGWKARAGFRSAVAPEDYELYLASADDPSYAEADGEIIVDVARHRFILMASPAVTARMKAPGGRWYVEVESPAGRVYVAVASSQYNVKIEGVV